MSVSIIIKALNEERHIERAIESALAALRATDRPTAAGEVILADSGSTDRTLDLAAHYPIRIARLKDPKDRRCGAGPQLGFQYATGDFICLIDGDMALDPRFLNQACALLTANPRAAGVGGFVLEKNLVSLEFLRRQKRGARDLEPGVVDRLNGGGLYRRAAIDSVGYFSDRNLHGYEEFDLAVRLRVAGWTLHRLPIPFVDHYGHVVGGYRLLWRRFTTGYLCGIGEVFRGSIGRAHFARTLTDLPEIRLWVGVCCAWLAAIVVLLTAPFTAFAAPVLAVLLLGPIAALSLRYRSLRLGIYAFTAWNAHALGMILGLMRPRVPAGRWIESDIVHPATGLTEPPSVAAPTGSAATSTGRKAAYARQGGVGLLLFVCAATGVFAARPAKAEGHVRSVPLRTVISRSMVGEGFGHV